MTVKRLPLYLVAVFAALTLLFQTHPRATYLPSSQPWTVVTTTATGTQNDFAPGLQGNTVVRCNNASLLTISGFAGGVDGQHVLVESVGAGEVDLPYQTGSSAANQLLNPATSGPTPLAPGFGKGEYVYDGTASRWRLVQHEQGAWITPAFDATKWTAATGTWTTSGGGTLVDGYYLRGRTLSFAVTQSGTSVSATPASLRRDAYGFTIAARKDFVILENDNGTIDVGTVNVSASGTTLGFFRKTGNWATAAGTTSLFVEGFVEVQ